MLITGRCCHCGESKPPSINLKCFNKSDGTIVWEFGPCFAAVQQYGADYIHAFTSDNVVTFNTFIHTVATDGQTLTLPNRSVVSLSPNVASGIFDVVRLNSITGAEVNRSAVSWLFSAYERTAPTEGGVDVSGALIGHADGLSGGEMIISGHIPIQIELTDYASNNVTKTYIFHPHTSTAGTLTLKTRVSDQTITCAFNVSAATLKTAIESVGDVASATVTGGPWPLAALNVSVTWTSSAGDFKSTQFTATTLAGFSDRPTPASLFLVNPTTGNITKTFGYIFGNYSSAVKLHPSVSGLIPTVPDAVEPGAKPIAGASNSFCVSQTAALISNSNWFEGWSATSSTELWCVFNNHSVTHNSGRCIVWTNRSQNGNVFMTGQRRTYAGSNWVGARVSISGGTRTEIDNSLASLDNDSNVTIEQDGAAGTYAHSLFSARFQQTEDTNYLVVDEAGELNVNGSLFRVGSISLFGLDSSDFFCWHGGYRGEFVFKFPQATPSMIAATNARGYLWRFYANPRVHYGTGTEFRFRFAGNSNDPIMYSSWIDWNASAATISTALNSVFPANTAGVVSNAQVFPFGTPSALVNTTGYLERYVEVMFAGAANATGVSELYIPAAYVRRARITIEMRSIAEEFVPPGIASFDRTTGALNWSRPFGTKGAVAVPHPRDAWIRGSYVYAYGQVVDDEIP